MEPTLWQRKELPVHPKHTVLITTEHTHTTAMSPFLQQPPTSSLSSDSGLADGNRSSTGSSSIGTTFSPEHSFSPNDHHPPPHFSLPTSPVPIVPFSSQSILVTSGPGFSIGVFPCGDSDDSYEHLSVPILQEGAPQETISQSLELANIFAMAEILCTSMPSENQLWMGTDKGTLHSLELVQQQSFNNVKPDGTFSNGNSYKLTNHTWLAINEPLVSVCVRPSEYVFPSDSPTTSLSEEPPKSEVLVGVPYGYVVILHGEVNEGGRFKDPLERISRRIVRLTNSPTDCNVKCIAHVPPRNHGNDETTKEETYWCSCGGDIIILQSSNWAKVGTINAREIQSVVAGRSGARSEVIQMLVCDMGVWVGVSQSSIIVLWDKISYEPKLSLTYCDPHRSRQQRSHISILHYMSPYLFIGTQRGDVMVFQINTSTTTQQSPQKQSKNKTSYTFITNTSIGSRPIINIYTTPTETRPHIPPLDSISSGDSFITSPTPYQSSIHVLIITGSGGGEGGSQVLLYELTLPHPTSLSLRSSPTLSVGSNSTMGGSIRSNTPISVTPGKIRLFSSVGDFTPLRDRGTERRNSSFI